MNKIKVLLVVAILTLLVPIMGCFNSQTGPLVGKVAPDFTLTSLNGDVTTLSSFKGKQVLLSFWATWCNPCVFEMPYIQEIYDEYSPQGLILLTIASWEDRNTVQEFITQNQFTFPVLIDYPDKDAAYKYQVRTIPATFIISEKGTIKAVKIGAFGSKADIENLLK